MLNAEWLPVIFIGLMGLAVFLYAILDGYDLGVGILLPLSASQEAVRDRMIASIGPFWDANETWLVLAVGLLLIAFPAAHSVILRELYLPVAVMLVALIMRGVAFDFRAKAAVDFQSLWDKVFKLGSLLTALAQGYMLGRYVLGFAEGWAPQAFALLSGLCVSAAYSYIGAAWLILKTEGELQRRAIGWARRSGRVALLGVLLVSVVNPWVNPTVYDRWFDWPLVMFVLLVPVLCLGLFVANDVVLGHLSKVPGRWNWLPFTLVAGVFALCFVGLVFSFFPDIVPGQMDIWQAASAPESLQFILWGAVVVIPLILGYTAFSYWVFKGKATELTYY